MLDKFLIAPKDSICRYFRNIRPDLLHLAIENVVFRIQPIVDNEEGHMEHLLQRIKKNFQGI